MSQKVKEIEVYLQNINYEIQSEASVSTRYHKTFYPIKATLLVPVEEKKIELTESMFDKAAEDSLSYNGNRVWEKTPSDYLRFVKEKLFSRNGG